MHSVNHELLFRKLERMGIRGNMLKLLRAMYQGNSQSILLNGMVGDPIQLLVGVRQLVRLPPLANTALFYALHQLLGRL